MLEGDYKAWLPLWFAYNDFYRNEVTEGVTQAAFRRLCDGSEGFCGLVAEEDGELVGLAHMVFHPPVLCAGVGRKEELL